MHLLPSRVVYVGWRSYYHGEAKVWAARTWFLPPKEGAILKDLAPESESDRQLRTEALSDGAEAQFHRLLHELPVAAYTCDAEGLITYFNENAVKVWGRAPKLNDPSDRYCGSFKLFSANGLPIPHDRCWMALALKSGEGHNRREIVVERPDGRQRTVLAHANPLYEESGELLGAVNLLVDITARKRAEEQRDRIFSLTPDLVCVARLDGYFERVNPAFEETLGYTSEELAAKPFFEFVHPDDRESTIQEVAKLGTGAPTLHFENRYLRKDGSHAWLAWKAVPVVEEGLIYAAARDVTDQKIADAELREAELFARSTLDSLSANIAILDESGTIVATNMAWREFGSANGGPAKSGVAEGANYLAVCDEATGAESGQAAAFAEGIRGVISGRRETFELEYPCHTPSERLWYVGRVTRFPDTRPLKIVVAHENITGRKLIEEEIRKRARQQAAVAELGQHALSQTGLSDLLEEAVATVARVLEVEFCKVDELSPEGDALLLRAGEGWKEGLVGRATVGVGLDSQAGYTLLSNEPVIVEDLRSEVRFGAPPLLLDHGVVSGMSVVIHGRDGPFGVLGAYAGERRTFTREDTDFLQAVANVLATVVAQEKAAQELREIREAERRRIARDMHDEVLQDLTYVLAETQLMQAMSEDSGQDDRLLRSVEALKRAGQGIRTAIFDLRLGDDEDLTFAEQLDALVELNRRYSPERKIELSIEEDLFLPEPQQTELLHILQEALANVRRHSRARQVSVAVKFEDDRLRAEVSDNGKGFDQHSHAGMGTRGMRERARALGGELEITSKPGKGTKVRVELGQARDANASDGETRVLLVEDHASLRQAVASVFDREPGFAVVGQAGTLAEARDLLGDADVVVIDLSLPDGHGAQLIREIRKSSPWAQTLVLSAHADRVEVARAVEAGAAGVLHKSAGVDEVVDAVRRLRAGESLLPLEEVVELLRSAGSRREREQEAMRSIAQLTSREKDVLRAVAQGFSGQEIADRLNISLRTERNHMASILAKLGVNSRLQALVFALRHGVVAVTGQGRDPAP